MDNMNNIEETNNSEEMNNIQPEQEIEETPKKKSKVPILIALLCIVMICVGVGVGYFLPKLLDKPNKENTSLKESKDNNTEKEEETKEEPPVEEEKKEEVKEYTKPARNSKYTFVKEDEQLIKLNGKEYHLVSYYYEDTDSKLKKAEAFGLIKEVYFEGNLIVKNAKLMYFESKDKNDTIKDDIAYTKKMTTVLKDKKSSEQYLVYFYEDDFFNMMWAEDEDDPGSPDDSFDAMVVTKDGEILFEKPVWVAGSVCYIWVDNKDEVLDRYTVPGTEDESYLFGEDGEYDGSKYYSIYNGNVHGETYPIEFKEDHFYYFTGPFTNEGNKDYLYTIENGTLKSKLIKEYKGDGPFLIDGAGQGCDEE